MTTNLPNPYSEHVLATHEREKAKYGQALQASNADKVRVFHETAEIQFSARPALVSEEEYNLSRNLVFEELNEWGYAHYAGDLTEVADALSDLLYVVYRAALAYGLPIDEIFAEVHRSNMTKFPGGKVIRREDGKILKPDSWEPPKIKEILDGYESGVAGRS